MAIDDMSREAIKKGLKKVVLGDTANAYRPKAVSFQGGVLKIDHQPFANNPYVTERERAVVDVLEDGL